MNKLKVCDLLDRFVGDWNVYEPVKNSHGEEIDQKLIACHKSPQSVKDAVRQRTVHDFTGCINFGINIYLD